jgi:hypothetical protein
MVLCILMAAFWAGCSNDEDIVNNETPSEIDVISILVNPLSPAPGATVILTAQVAGSGASAAYEWVVSGGTLNDNGKISVTWTVPDETDVVYRVSVRGVTGTAVDTSSTYVLVRTVETIPSSLKIALFPQFFGGKLYCVGTNGDPLDKAFRGYRAYEVGQTVPLDNMTSPVIDGGYEFSFVAGGLLTSSIINYSASMTQQSRNVYFFPYGDGTKWAVSGNETGGRLTRRHQNVNASISSDNSMVVWQNNRVGTREDGTRDLINIKFRYGTSTIATITTAVDSIWSLGAWTYKYFHNIRPLFSPDNGMIIYFNDSTRTYEPCLIPMAGNEPVLEERRALLIDRRRGIFSVAGVSVDENTTFQWNPAIPTQVGFIDTKNQFCIFDYVAETVEVFGDGVQEFAWSQDGKLAAVTAEGVYVADAAQAAAELVYAKERSSDGVIGVNWSPGLDNQRIGFRVVRKGKSSLESFAVLVIYYLDYDRWYYASGQITGPAGSEPKVKYRWLQVKFDPATGALVAPVPLAAGDGTVVLYRSY